MKTNTRQKYLRRKFRALALAVLPRTVAHWWIRNALNLAISERSTKFHFEIASSVDDLKHALTLVQKNFEREGYTATTSGSVRLTPYHLLPQTIVIIAKLNNKIVATISVVPRTAFGVPLDGCLPLDMFANDKGKMVEISALAVDPSIRGEQGEVLYSLMKYMYHCNVDVLKANTEVIGVNPKMLPLYEAILLFKKIPGTKTVAYEFANGAPVVPMYFDLNTAQQTYETVYRGKPVPQNVMKFFLATPPPNFSLPSTEALDNLLPQRKSSELRQILQWNPEILRSFTSEQLTTLIELYKPWPDCAHMIRETANDKP